MNKTIVGVLLLAGAMWLCLPKHADIVVSLMIPLGLYLIFSGSPAKT